MVDPSQRTLTRVEYVGLSMVTCRVICILLVVEESALAGNEIVVDKVLSRERGSGEDLTVAYV
jgi:hypothetical protein